MFRGDKTEIGHELPGVVKARDVAEFRDCGFRFKPAGYSDLKAATIPE